MIDTRSGLNGAGINRGTASEHGTRFLVRIVGDSPRYELPERPGIPGIGFSQRTEVPASVPPIDDGGWIAQTD